MPALALAEVSTPLGPMLLAATERGLAAIGRVEDQAALVAGLARRLPTARLQDDPSALANAAGWLVAFLAGERRDLPAVDLTGVPGFDAAVYRAVRAVPYGATATYGEIAAATGSPRAARAVGAAMFRCPLFPAVPCHRVVRAADGWSGWGSDDLAVKLRLLAMERGAAPGLQQLPAAQPSAPIRPPSRCGLPREQQDAPQDGRRRAWLHRGKPAADGNGAK